MLARAVAETPDMEAAFRIYGDTRRDRTARIQLGSRGNADRVYARDAWRAKLTEGADA